MKITRKIEDKILRHTRQSWTGDFRVDYKALIQVISKDPPGILRKDENRAKPKYFNFNEVGKADLIIPEEILSPGLQIKNITRTSSYNGFLTANKAKKLS